MFAPYSTYRSICKACVEGDEVALISAETFDKIWKIMGATCKFMCRTNSK